MCFELQPDDLKFSHTLLLQCNLLEGRRVGRSPLNPPPPFEVQGVLNALSDSCQFLSDSKSLLWPPPCPPTLHKISTVAHDCRPKPPTLSILSRLFAVRKLIKNQTLQNSSQNVKTGTPDRPILGFGLAFESILAWIYHEILDFVKIC